MSQETPGPGFYMVETILGVMLFYLFLGGSSAHPAAWAVFTVFAVWIVLMNVRRDAGLESRESYSRWQLQVGLLFVVIMFAAGLWSHSWWIIGLGVLLGIFWRGNLRVHRRIYQKFSVPKETTLKQQ